MENRFITPDWPAPARVRALVTTRAGGVSLGPYASFNLGDHVGDDPGAVAENRARLRRCLPAGPVWLRQVHGAEVVEADTAEGVPEADGAVARKPGTVCAVLTADCLPVLFCDQAGSVVGAAHAGWRGLAGGVLEAAVRAMGVPTGRLMAWLGPAISPRAFEVGEEVRQIFVAQDPEAIKAFVPHSVLSPQSSTCGTQKWLADIYLLARQRLGRAGVPRIYGGGFCTFTEAERFYSYRRDGATGRMASLIWLE